MYGKQRITLENTRDGTDYDLKAYWTWGIKGRKYSKVMTKFLAWKILLRLISFTELETQGKE